MASTNVVLTFHRINGWIASTYGFAINLLLIQLVYRSKIRHYKLVFLQMCFIDCFFLFFSALVDPIAVFLDGIEVIVQNGFLRDVSQPWALISLTGWIFGLYFAVFSLCVQFLYRYFQVCKRITISARGLLCMLALPMGMAALIAVLFAISFSFEAAVVPVLSLRLAPLLAEAGAESIRPAGIAHAHNIPLFVLIALAFLMLVGNYAIIAVCVVRVNRTLECLAPHLKCHTKALHRQLSLVMTVQAALPLLISVVPLLFIFWCIVTQGTAFYSLLFMMFGFSWVPSVNATVTLLCVQQFRERLVRSCLPNKRTTTPSQSANQI